MSGIEPPKQEVLAEITKIMLERGIKKLLYLSLLYDGQITIF